MKQRLFLILFKKRSLLLNLLLLCPTLLPFVLRVGKRCYLSTCLCLLRSKDYDLYYFSPEVKEKKERILIQEGIQVAVYAIVRPVQPVFHPDGAHAALAAFSLDAAGNVASRAKEQLSLIAIKAWAGAAVHFA